MTDTMVACSTMGCEGRAERFVSCEDEGAFPYCGECADVLLRHGETELGAVDDPVVADRDRYLLALQKIENRLSGHPHSTDLSVIGEWVRDELGDKA